MSMVTRCPNCATAFRVTPAQLQARKGDVRCGRCAAVFNAFESLATVQEPLLTEPQPGDQPEAPTEAAQAGSAAPPAAGLHKTPVESLALQKQESLQAEVAGGEVDEAMEYVEWPKHETARGWLAGSALLLALLAGQAAYYFRTELTVLFPESKPYLLRFCELLQCTIPLPKIPEMLSIESSDLQADPARSSVVMLSATLRNRAPFTQAFPALELTLTDTSDQPVARRVFRASEYLDKSIDVEAGMDPNKEVTVKLNLDSGDLRPSGYRLFLFYP